MVAAERITDELSNLESSLESSISDMSSQLGWADSQLGDTESTLRSIQGLVARLTEDTDNANSRLRELFIQDKRKDPVKEKARLKYVNRLIRQIREDKKLYAHVVAGGKLSVQSKQPEDSDITEEDAKLLLDIAVSHVHNTERDKAYQIVVKAPKDCSNDELDGFAAKVANGGEVGDGVRDRAKRAFRIGFVVYDNVIVGTAALKNPSASYRAKVFKKANSQLDSAAYPYELGWIFLDVVHRKKGQMTRLINELTRQLAPFRLWLTINGKDFIVIMLMAQPDLAVIAAAPDVMRRGGAVLINSWADGRCSPCAQELRELLLIVTARWVQIEWRLITGKEFQVTRALQKIHRKMTLLPPKKKPPVSGRLG